MKFERFTPNTERGEMSAERPSIEHMEVDDIFEDVTPEQLQVRRQLESLDRDTLEDIFREYYQKSGNAPETMNFIPLDKIALDTRIEEMGAFGLDDEGKQIMVLNHDLLKDNPAALLHTLIHEQLHAVTTVSRKNGEYQEEETVYFRNRVGYDRPLHSNTTSRENKVYTSANEGFTEYLTEKIFAEYLTRTGAAEQFGRDTIARLKESHLASDYGEYTIRVKAYMKLLEVLSDVPEETIEQGMIRGYFRNSDLVPTEVANELEEIHPKLFIAVFRLLDAQEKLQPSQINDIFIAVFNYIPDSDTEKREKIEKIALDLLDDLDDHYKAVKQTIPGSL